MAKIKNVSFNGKKISKFKFHPAPKSTEGGVNQSAMISKVNNTFMAPSDINKSSFVSN
jgi:hypothetical protein